MSLNNRNRFDISYIARTSYLKLQQLRKDDRSSRIEKKPVAYVLLLMTLALFSDHPVCVGCLNVAGGP